MTSWHDFLLSSLRERDGARPVHEPDGSAGFRDHRQGPGSSTTGWAGWAGTYTKRAQQPCDRLQLPSTANLWAGPVRQQPSLFIQAGALKETPSRSESTTASLLQCLLQQMFEGTVTRSQIIIWTLWPCFCTFYWGSLNLVLRQYWNLNKDTQSSSSVCMTFI